jgi:hypothetical protein
MYEFLDASAIRRALASRRRPRGPVLRPWLLGDKALFWWSDPMPAISGVRQAVGRRLSAAVQRRRRVPTRSAGAGEPSNHVVPAIPFHESRGENRPEARFPQV